MVGGFFIAVTQVPRVSQCADIHKIACGRGISLAMFRKPRTNSFSSMAFIGLPCPKNNTGILPVLFIEVVTCFNVFNLILHLLLHLKECGKMSRFFIAECIRHLLLFVLYC